MSITSNMSSNINTADSLSEGETVLAAREYSQNDLYIRNE